MDLLFIGAGGVLGAITRFAIGKRFSKKGFGNFPMGTFLINTSGAFMLGLLINIFTKHMPSHHYLKLMLTTGFLGAYTTFSTFTYETIILMENNEYLQAVKYILFTFLLGIALCWIAYIFGETI